MAKVPGSGALAESVDVPFANHPPEPVGSTLLVLSFRLMLKIKLGPMPGLNVKFSIYSAMSVSPATQTVLAESLKPPCPNIPVKLGSMIKVTIFNALGQFGFRYGTSISKDVYVSMSPFKILK